MFSKTETLRRLRLVSMAMKNRCNLPANATAEVGHRIHPAASPTFPTHDDVYGAEHDDLSHMEPIRYAATDPTVRAHGAIVHIYLSSGFGYDRELRDVCVGWLGTPDEEPAIYDLNGIPVTTPTV